MFSVGFDCGVIDDDIWRIVEGRVVGIFYFKDDVCKIVGYIKNCFNGLSLFGSSSCLFKLVDDIIIDIIDVIFGSELVCLKVVIVVFELVVVVCFLFDVIMFFFVNMFVVFVVRLF